MNIEVTSHNGVFLSHPDGGHCNVVGMTDDCYGCVCYGCALIDQCVNRVKELREWICKEYKIPREFMFTKDGNSKNIEYDKRFDSFVEKLKTCIESDIKNIKIEL